MKIDFEHLGPIEQGSIELNDFTLFCGKNNSGKTYAMYSIYGLLDEKLSINFDFVKSIVEQLTQDGQYPLNIADVVSQHQEAMVKHIEESLKASLPSLFGIKEDVLLETKIRLHFSDNEIKERIKNKSYFLIKEINGPVRCVIVEEPNVGSNSLFFVNADTLYFYISEMLVNIIFFDWRKERHSFLLPAERAGINLFFKELFSVRNLLLQQAQNDKVNPMHLLKDVLDARYADPIKDYTQFLSRIGSDRELVSDYCSYAQILEQNVLGGNYEVDEFGNIFFLPANSNNKLPLHFSSSTVKTLFGLVFYLQHLAKRGDYLFIDEPELNLHPDNQRQVARILAQLVNAGLKVVVSTHSDYFVRELNNLIMLKKGFTGADILQKEYGYQDNELLDASQISAYLFDDKKISLMEMDDDEGIVAQTFDDVINKLNKSSNDIYYAMQEAKGNDD